MFWMLEVVAFVNAYILYTSTLREASQQPRSHLQFRRELVLELVAHQLQLPAPGCPGRRVNLSLERLRPVPHFSEESYRRRDCRVCSGVGWRRTTTCVCTTSSDRPYLHPGHVPYEGGVHSRIVTLVHQNHISMYINIYTLY